MSINKILCATDFRPEARPAFAHALRFALDTKAKLYVAHVADRGDDEHWSRFPHVREMLGRWGLFDPAKPPQAIEAELGLHVAKVSLQGSDLRTAIAQFAVAHDCDLLVLWTHDRRGRRGFLTEGPIAGGIARASGVPTLFLPGAIRGFVDVATGRLALETILVPLGDEFDCRQALKTIMATTAAFAPAARLRYLHVGEALQRGFDYGAGETDIMLRPGPVVEAIVSATREIGAGLIAMPTAGRHGLFDALRGSTTERVLREAGLPLLAAPV